MAKIAEAQRLLTEAEAMDSSSPASPSSRRPALLGEAETALKAALALTDTRDPVHLSRPSVSVVIPKLSTYIDPALPLHIITLLGKCSLLQGPSHYASAESYYNAALRGFAAEAHREEEQAKSQPQASEAKAFFDAQILGVGRQLAHLYSLRGNDIAAESSLLRCLELLRDLRATQQGKDKRSVGSAGQSGDIASDGVARRGSAVSPSEYSDDVAAEIAEQLSSVYRARGDFPRAVEWADGALRMNDQAAAAKAPLGADADDARLQRQTRALHLYSGLASDFFALHAAPATKAESVRSASAPSPLEHAYHAAVHALEALDAVTDAVATSSTAGKSLGKPLPLSTPRVAAPSSPPLRAASVVGLPDTSHSAYLSGSSAARVLAMSPSSERSSLVVEVIACYSNLATVLSAGGKDEDADAAWGIAETAARTLRDSSYLDIIAEQKAMLRPHEGGT